MESTETTAISCCYDVDAQFFSSTNTIMICYVFAEVVVLHAKQTLRAVPFFLH